MELHNQATAHGKIVAAIVRSVLMRSCRTDGVRRSAAPVHGFGRRPMWRVWGSMPMRFRDTVCGRASRPPPPHTGPRCHLSQDARRQTEELAALVIPAIDQVSAGTCLQGGQYQLFSCSIDSADGLGARAANVSLMCRPEPPPSPAETPSPAHPPHRDCGCHWRARRAE
jgi:hypothetical protein